MSDEQNEQERDAAVTPEMRAEIQEIILTVRRGMDRAITAHGRTLTAMQEMHMGAFDQALFVDTAIGEIDRLTAERDAARAEVERLRAACSRKEDVYPTETVITRSASDLLVEFSQFAFFLGDIRKSKEASYRAQYIRAALDIESEENE